MDVTTKTWGERRGSNPRHPGPQPGALPAELRPPCVAKSTRFYGVVGPCFTEVFSSESVAEINTA